MNRINNAQRKALVGVVSEVMSRKIPVCRWAVYEVNC
jgi:hypothetical protein